MEILYPLQGHGGSRAYPGNTGHEARYILNGMLFYCTRHVRTQVRVDSLPTGRFFGCKQGQRERGHAKQTVTRAQVQTLEV